MSAVFHPAPGRSRVEQIAGSAEDRTSTDRDFFSAMLVGQLPRTCCRVYRQPLGDCDQTPHPDLEYKYVNIAGHRHKQIELEISGERALQPKARTSLGEVGGAALRLQNPSRTAWELPHRLLHGLPLLPLPSEPTSRNCLSSPRQHRSTPTLAIGGQEVVWEPLSSVWMPRLLLLRRRNGCGSSNCSPDLLLPRGPPPTAVGYVPAASARKVPPSHVRTPPLRVARLGLV